MTDEPRPHNESPTPAKPLSVAEQTILELCAARGPEKTVDPNEVAKTIATRKSAPDAAGPDDWHKWLGEVRRMAVKLARAGQLVIYRKGKPVDPDDFRGVYRLGLPRHD